MRLPHKFCTRHVKKKIGVFSLKSCPILMRTAWSDRSVVCLLKQTVPIKGNRFFLRRWSFIQGKPSDLPAFHRNRLEIMQRDFRYKSQSLRTTLIRKRHLQTLSICHAFLIAHDILYSSFLYPVDQWMPIALLIASIKKPWKSGFPAFHSQIRSLADMYHLYGLERIYTISDPSSCCACKSTTALPLHRRRVFQATSFANAHFLPPYGYHLRRFPPLKASSAASFQMDRFHSAIPHLLPVWE